MPGTSNAVFLSYASEDAEAAGRIAEALRAAGIEVWFDKSELRGGDVWDQKIRGQIRECALFIPVITSNTKSRHEGYFRLEWDLADQRTHMIARNRAFIVPVCTDNTPDSAADVPESFVRVQWTRLPGGDTPAPFVERVARLLAPGHSEAPVPRTAAAPLAPKRSNLVPLLAAAITSVGLGYGAWSVLTPSKHATVSAPIASAPSAIPEQSVAVLPFVNMSPDKDQEYFSDGLTEEMIDLLGRLPDLRVPARTSSFYFKGKSETIATIAQQLKVAHVLEGSVRKAGNRLRITAQLIRADSGYHLWSQTYDRDDKDIFAVQDDIAQAVVKVLQVKLSARAPFSGSRGTTNTEAYSQYLLARQLFQHGNQEGYVHAIAAYKRALFLDPQYAQAYAGLAIATAWVADFSGDTPAIERARLDANKAIALAPNDALGYEARGVLRTYWLLDWSGALTDYEQALTLNPRSSEIRRRYADVLDIVGRVPEAIVAHKQAIDLDPLDGPAWSNLGYCHTELRDYVAAYSALTRALELEPQAEGAHVAMGILQLVRGTPQQARATFMKIDYALYRLMGVALTEHSLGNEQSSQQALHDMVTKYARSGAYQIAVVYAWRGEPDTAFQWLDRAYRQKDGGLPSVRGDPLLVSLRPDPRFNELLRKMKLPELHSS